MPLLRGLPGIAATHTIGTDYQAQRFDAAIDLNWAVESGEEAQRRPRQDLFAKLLHVRLNRRAPIYRVASSERRWARQQLAQNYDAHYGGFGGTPKFPHPTNLEIMPHTWADSTDSDTTDTEAMDMALSTTQHIACGGRA